MLIQGITALQNGLLLKWIAPSGEAQPYLNENGRLTLLALVSVDHIFVLIFDYLLIFVRLIFPLSFCRKGKFRLLWCGLVASIRFPKELAARSISKPYQ
jgi:hypothetical protein